MRLIRFMRFYSFSGLAAVNLVPLRRKVKKKISFFAVIRQETAIFAVTFRLFIPILI